MGIGIRIWTMGILGYGLNPKWEYDSIFKVFQWELGYGLLTMGHVADGL